MNGRVQVSGTTRMALFTIVIVVAVLKLAQEVFIPLALAILCTFLLALMVSLLTRFRVNRLLAVVLSLGIGLALIGGLGTLVFNQFADLARELPSYQRQLRTNLTQRPRDVIQLAAAGLTSRAIVISALPPEAVTAARAVCKLLRTGNNDVPVFVGLWNAVGDLDRPRQRLAAAGATRTVISFAECFELLDTCVAPPRDARACENAWAGACRSNVSTWNP